MNAKGRVVCLLGPAFALLACASATAGQPVDPAAVRRELEQRVEQLGARGTLDVAGGRIASAAVLVRLYEDRGFEPLWTPAAAEELRWAVHESAEDGLSPHHYHMDGLLAGAAAGEGATPRALADLELLRTDALVRLTHDLRYGRTEPTPGIARVGHDSEDAEQQAAAVARMILSGRLRDEVGSIRPRHFVYRGLVGALAELRRTRETGGWARVPDGPTLRRDSADARVPLLRARLAAEPGATATAAAAPDTSTVFDGVLEQAVRVFQHRHGLNDDGVVGASTLAELNVPVERRIEQVRINLERARWVTQDLPGTFVAVNAAGARVYVIRDEQVVFESRVVVGRTYTKTPVFTAPMRTIVLNPTWTVPPGIVGEVLAAVRKDPGYLRRENLRVLDNTGRQIHLGAGDLARWTGRTFPYVFRQDPGPGNALGRIKLLFPNRYNVYLHDTPSKSLFEREQRTFSHGCIRVQDPVGLAEQVLNDPVLWSRERIEEAIAPGTTRTILLPTPVPVLVLYWTAAADLHGELHFYRDVYERDAALLKELDRE